jgi:hypothetical protein
MRAVQFAVLLFVADAGSEEIEPKDRSLLTLTLSRVTAPPLPHVHLKLDRDQILIVENYFTRLSELCED